MNILIIEDEAIIAKTISHILSKLKIVHIIEFALNFEDGFNKASSGVFDIFLVDLCLSSGPEKGLELCSLIRKQFPQHPIIVVSSIHSIEILEKAFELGINEYITKPFHPKELEVRVKRWKNLIAPESDSSLNYHELEYDTSLNNFFAKEKPLLMTRQNKRLMRLFMQHPEEMLSTSFLQRKLWGIDTLSSSRNLRNPIHSLRKALGKEYSTYIKTVSGEGYILQK